MRVYTLWASMEGEEPSPWMIAAEDEFAWEGDAARCDAVFTTARKVADRNGWDTREITITLPYEQIAGAFDGPPVVGEVAPS